MNGTARPAASRRVETHPSTRGVPPHARENRPVPQSSASRQSTPESQTASPPRPRSTRSRLPSPQYSQQNAKSVAGGLTGDSGGKGLTWVSKKRNMGRDSHGISGEYRQAYFVISGLFCRNPIKLILSQAGTHCRQIQ